MREMVGRTAEASSPQGLGAAEKGLLDSLGHGTQPGSCEHCPSGPDWGHWDDSLGGLLESKSDP